MHPSYSRRIKKEFTNHDENIHQKRKILSQFQEQSRSEIIENAIGMMDGNFDHPYAWNGMPEELLKEAKDLWKVS